MSKSRWSRGARKSLYDPPSSSVGTVIVEKTVGSSGPKLRGAVEREDRLHARIRERAEVEAAGSERERGVSAVRPAGDGDAVRIDRAREEVAALLIEREELVDQKAHVQRSVGENGVHLVPGVEQRVAGMVGAHDDVPVAREMDCQLQVLEADAATAV